MALSRRDALRLLAASGAAACGAGLSACGSSASEARGRIEASLWYCYGGTNREVLLSLLSRFHAEHPDAARSDMRLAKIGFVFQRFFLLPMLTAWENVELPQAEARIDRGARRARTAELLEYVGLARRAHHLPSQLSGGEMQRVASRPLLP